MHVIKALLTLKTEKFIQNLNLNTRMYAIPRNVISTLKDISRMYVSIFNTLAVTMRYKFHSRFLFILQTENCSRFWFQPIKYQKQVEDVFNELNNPNNDLESIKNAKDIEIGQILAAAYPSDDRRQVEYYRAKVIFIQRKKNAPPRFEVSVYFSRN